MTRPLFCPICGVRVSVEVGYGSSSIETHVLPEHENGSGGNICQSFAITVSWDYVKCSRCGIQMVKHRSGLCARCHAEKANAESK
jgi:hypothetical protein